MAAGVAAAGALQWSQERMSRSQEIGKMNKLILSAVAAGACAFGAAVSAQDFGSVLGNILGTPQVVQGARPGAVYIDQYGRQVAVDQFGRQVLLQANPGIVGYDAWGRPVYGATPRARSGLLGAVVSAAQARDDDGDGVANVYDRAPNDAGSW
jgi:hypothetical protein